MFGFIVWYQWLLLATDVVLSFVVPRNFSISPYIRLFTFSLGLVALSLWWFCCRRYKFRIHRSPVAGLLIALSGLWLIIGISANETTPYIATDWFFYMGSLAIFLIARSMWIAHLRANRFDPQDYRLPNSLFVTICILLATYQWTGIRLNTAFAFLLLSDLGARIIFRQARAWHIALAAIAFMVFLIDANRSFLLSLAAASALIFSLGFLKSRISKFIALAFFGLAMPISFLVVLEFYATQNPNSALSRRLNETSVAIVTLSSGGRLEDMPISIYQRVYEAEQVLASIIVPQSGNLLIPLFGYGFGALIDMSNSSDEAVKENAQLGADKVHNIHFMPFMILYRFGLFGIFIFGYFIFKLFSKLSYYINSYDSHGYGRKPISSIEAFQFGCLIFSFSVLIYCMQASALIFDSTLVFIAVGILSVPINKRKNLHRHVVTS